MDSNAPQVPFSTAHTNLVPDGKGGFYEVPTGAGTPPHLSGAANPNGSQQSAPLALTIVADDAVTSTPIPPTTPPTSHPTAQTTPIMNPVTPSAPQSPLYPRLANTPPVATADGITLNRALFAVSRHSSAPGTLTYKNRFDLGDGNAIYLLALSQSELVELQTKAKEGQAKSGQLAREYAALQHERNLRLAQLDRWEALRMEERRVLNELAQAQAGTPEYEQLNQTLAQVLPLVSALSEPQHQEEYKAVGTRLLEIDARCEVLDGERNQLQLDQLPVLDELLASKVVACEWREGEAVRRTRDTSDVLNDFELKSQVAELLMGAAEQNKGGSSNFLARR